MCKKLRARQEGVTVSEIDRVHFCAYKDRPLIYCNRVLVLACAQCSGEVFYSFSVTVPYDIGNECVMHVTYPAYL